MMASASSSAAPNASSAAPQSSSAAPNASAARTGDPAVLELALALRGLDAAVEARGALALITPRGALRSLGGARPADEPASAFLPSSPLDVAARRWLVQAALAAGFTHVALEVGIDDDAVTPGEGVANGDDDHTDATLPRRHPA